MRLSLYILADWLAKYQPSCCITRGERTIRNVRMFADDSKITANNVYVGRIGFDSGGVICIHENDYLLLNTEDETQVANEIMDAFDYYNDWSDRLNRELRNLSLQEILESSARVLNATLMLADASYYILAHAFYPSNTDGDQSIQEILDQGIMEMDQILNVEKDPKIREYRRHSYLQETGGFFLTPSVRNLFTNGRHWGWLISAAQEPTRGKMDVQDELGDILEQWMQFNQEHQKHWERNGVFINILDETYPSRDSVFYQMQIFGFPQKSEKWVYAAFPAENALAMIRKIEQLSSCVTAFVYENHLVVIAYGGSADRRRFEREFAHILVQSGCRCGISPVFTDIFALKRQFELAKAALDFGDADKILCPFQDCALNYGLHLLQQEAGDWLVHPALQLLKDYDRENRTEFCKTLSVFVRCERSYAQTAAELQLHRNTLLYRISRIQEITQLNLEDPMVRLHLLISYALDRKQSKP